jgi:hypothetical protein
MDLFAAVLLLAAQAKTAAKLSAYARECQPVGYQKIQDQAKDYGITIDLKTFRLQDKDERAWSPSNLQKAWPKPVLAVLTQKSLGYACF